MQKPYHYLLWKITKIIIQHCILNASSYLILLSSNRIIKQANICKQCKHNSNLSKQNNLKRMKQDTLLFKSKNSKKLPHCRKFIIDYCEKNSTFYHILNFLDNSRKNRKLSVL